MGGETGAINTVIEVLVEKIVELFMLGFESLREKIDLFVFRKLIEGAVEHRANVVFAIVDDLFCFLVPKHRDRDSFLKIWIGRSVGFAQIMKTIDWISRFEFIEVFQRRTRSRSFRIAKGPTFLVAKGVFLTLEFAGCRRFGGELWFHESLKGTATSSIVSNEICEVTAPVHTHLTEDCCRRRIGKTHVPTQSPRCLHRQNRARNACS